MSDLDIIKKKIKDTITKRHVILKDIFSLSLRSISDELFQVRIITKDINRSPTYDGIIQSFLLGLTLIEDQSQLRKRCDTFLTALTNVGGPASDAAEILRKEWEQD